MPGGRDRWLQQLRCGSGSSLWLCPSAPPCVSVVLQQQAWHLCFVSVQHRYVCATRAVIVQAGSLAVMDKALSCMDEAKRKKLEEMVQEAAAAKRSGAAAPARPAAAAASRSSSRGPSAPASVSLLADIWGVLQVQLIFSMDNGCVGSEWQASRSGATWHVCNLVCGCADP